MNKLLATTLLSALALALWASQASAGYLREDPSPERLVETLQRIEETMSDAVETPVVPMGVTIRLGQPIDARALPADMKSEAFTAQLRGQMQAQIDAQLAQGPPPAWGLCSRLARARLPRRRPTVDHAIQAPIRASRAELPMRPATVRSTVRSRSPTRRRAARGGRWRRGRRRTGPT